MIKRRMSPPNALAPLIGPQRKAPENAFAPRRPVGLLQPQPVRQSRPIDTTRPIIENDDGSFSTEETITVQRDGLWYNVPTIVGGVRMNPQNVENWFANGAPNIPHVGEFQTLDEAVREAQRRTDQIGVVRGPDRINPPYQ